MVVLQNYKIIISMKQKCKKKRTCIDDLSCFRYLKLAKCCSTPEFSNVRGQPSMCFSGKLKLCSSSSLHPR